MEHKLASPELLWSGTAPTSYTDLPNVSTLGLGVPSSCALRLLVVNDDAVNWNYFGTRPNGSSSDLFSGNSTNGQGALNGACGPGVGVEFLCATEDGVVELNAQTAYDCSVYVISWLDATMVDPTAADAATITGLSVSNAAWTTADFSGLVGANVAALLCEIVQTGGTAGRTLGARDSNDTEDRLCEYATPGTNQRLPNPNAGYVNSSTGARAAAIILCGTDGKAELRSNIIASAPTVSIFVHCSLDDYEAVGTSKSFTTLSGSYRDVDVSTELAGASDDTGLLFVGMRNDHVASTGSYLDHALRGNGDTEERYSQAVSQGGGSCRMLSTELVVA